MHILREEDHQIVNRVIVLNKSMEAPRRPYFKKGMDTLYLEFPCEDIYVLRVSLTFSQGTTGGGNCKKFLLVPIQRQAANLSSG